MRGKRARQTLPRQFEDNMRERTDSRKTDS
ncbi:hypothetical protein Metal_1252 [Methylomicrobium album BG8]|uniref:Uncharacterized protein n=1 Tax=Methylomicrobium album BG8 TaxID=686340 RepID=H8GIM6_METAL|nr:hypothetical protein Metal_1252 [Methylomicrobium album BG8]